MKKTFFIGILLTTFLVGTFFGQWVILQKKGFAYAAELVNQLPVERIQEFTEVFSQIRANYVEEVNPDNLMESAISGMVASLDPHSRYLNQQALTDFQKSMTGEQFGGVGIYIGTKDGWIEVISPIADTPAERAGIESGDLVLKIDGVSTQNLPIDKAVGKMRGKEGTLVTLEILSNVTKKTRKVELIRAKITSPSVVSSLLKDDFAYIRISGFREKTAPDLVDTLNKLYDDNGAPLQGIILDLRNNPGGFLIAGIDVAAAFLPQGKRIVSDKGRVAPEKVYYGKSSSSYPSSLGRLNNAQALENVPLVVLVNRGSASASEIVAGALQDNERAVIIGEKTYGKASVQSVAPLRTSQGKTALRLTTARYYTPDGTSIQARGIEPDIAVVLQEIKVEEETEEDNRFFIREGDLEGHLENNQDEEATEQSADQTDPIDQAEQAVIDKKATLTDRPLFINEQDNQYQQAHNILKALSIKKI